MHANIQLQDATVEMDIHSSLVGVLILLFKLKMKLQDSQIVGGGAIAKKITRKTKT